MVPKPHTRRSPPVRTAGFESRNNRRPAGQLDSITAMSEAEFLGHWDDVRPVGPNSWTAKKSPDQRTGSVAMTLLSDGTWLLHDFAGTSTAQLLAERGLCLADLFPNRRQGRGLSLAERREVSEVSRMSRLRAAWNAIGTEVAIVEVAAREVAAGQVLDEADQARVALAADRVASARVQVAQLEQNGDADHLGPRPGRFFRDLGADHILHRVAREEISQ